MTGVAGGTETHQVGGYRADGGGASRAEVELLRGLVAIPSPTGHEETASRWLVQQLQALGLEAGRDAVGNVVGIVEPAAGRATAGDVYLLGHIDTVEGFWPVELLEGRLSGRGASDAKGPLAAFVAAAVRARGSLRRRVLILAAVGEEGDSGGARHLARSLPPPDYLVVGEPSGAGRLVIGYRGRLRCSLELSRPGLHSSRPEPTAAEDGLALWLAVVEMVSGLNRGRSGFEAIDGHLLSIQTSSDGLRDSVRLELGFRLPVWSAPGDLLGRLRALAPQARIEPGGLEAAVSVGRTGALPSAFSRAILAQGGRPVWQRRLATSDLNVVLPVWSCPALVYGPGDSELDHTPQESISLDDYSRAIQVLAQVLAEL
ncbi:MAG: M20/M25/M40 family metallo-hydrolase [Candidatus Dormibacteria bacterium]